MAEPIERRWVKTPDGLYDPDAVPPEWYQWLRKRRNEAPSLHEVQQYVKCLFGCSVYQCSVYQCSKASSVACTYHKTQPGNMLSMCLPDQSVVSVCYTRMGSHRVQIRQKAAALDAEEAKRRFKVQSGMQATQLER